MSATVFILLQFQLRDGQRCMRYVEQPVQFLRRYAFRDQGKAELRAQSIHCDTLTHTLLCKHKEKCFSSNNCRSLNLKLIVNTSL